MNNDPNLNPPRPKGMTAFFRKAGESTTAFMQRLGPSTANSSILVGGLIGSYSTAKQIINRGIAGEPINIWHAVDFLWCFTIAACYSHYLWKTDPNARPKS